LILSQVSEDEPIRIGNGAYRFSSDGGYFPIFKIDRISTTEVYSVWESDAEPPSCFKELFHESVYKKTIKVIRQ
jgi:hypothetical protein